jgi:hypothetical protein
LGLIIENHTACQLLRIQDRQAFVKSAVARLATEVAAFRTTKISSSLASKVAEFIVWHIVLDGLHKFDEKHVHNTQVYDWLSTTSTPGIDIYGATRIDNHWFFAVVEIKWSEKCDYSQITSNTKGLLHDLRKLFEGEPSNRLSTRLSSLKSQLRRYTECSEAYHGLRNVIIGIDPKTTKGVQFVGFFVGDLKLASKQSGFDSHFVSFRSAANQLGWHDGVLDMYTVTGSPLYDILDEIARGIV